MGGAAVNVTVIGTADEPYTLAWHYAAAFEHLGLEVERHAQGPAGDRGVIVNLGGNLNYRVDVGRRSGLPIPLPPLEIIPCFTDDGVLAAEHENAHYLRAGCHGPEAHDSEPYPPWEPLWDVAFVGTSPGHPEWPHRAELVAHLRDWYGHRFLHLGPGGQTVTDDSQNVRADLRGHWLNRLYRSVPIVVSDSLFHDPDLPYWSERNYEVWARGGFLVHPANELLRQETGYVSSWTVGDWGSLRTEVDYWRNSPTARETYRQAMQETVRTRCTYEVRAAELLAMLGA
jgi:hypothetical protein